MNLIDNSDDSDYKGESDSDDDNRNSNDKSDSNDENTVLGVNSTLFWIMFILALLAIVPCVKHYQNQKKAQNENDIGNENTTRGGGYSYSNNVDISSKGKTRTRIDGNGIKSSSIGTSASRGTNSTAALTRGEMRSPRGNHSKRDIQQKAAMARKKQTQATMAAGAW